MSRLNAIAVCLLIVFVGTIVAWDRLRTQNRVKHRQDVTTSKILLTAAIAYGLTDKSIFHDFSPQAVVHAARNAGIQVDDVVDGGIPLRTGVLIGYSALNGVTFAKIQRGKVVDSVPLFTLSP